MENAAGQNSPATSGPAHEPPASSPAEESRGAVVSSPESASRKKRNKLSKSMPKAPLPGTSMAGQQPAASPPSPFGRRKEKKRVPPDYATNAAENSTLSPALSPPTLQGVQVEPTASPSSPFRRRKGKKRVPPDSVADTVENSTPFPAPPPPTLQGVQLEPTRETPGVQETAAQTPAKSEPSARSLEQKQDSKVDPQPSGAATAQQLNRGVKPGVVIGGGTTANGVPVPKVQTTDEEDMQALSVPSLCKRRGDNFNLASQPGAAADKRRNAERGDKAGLRSSSRREAPQEEWQNEEIQLPTGEAAITAIFGGNSTYQRLALGFVMMTYFSLAIHLFISTVIAENVRFACLPPGEVNATLSPQSWVKTNGWAKDDDRACFLLNNETGNATSRSVLPCTAWVYELAKFKNNIIQEWDLVCSRQHVRPLLQLIFIAGGLVTWVLPFLIDWAGRRPVILAGVVASVACSVAAYFVESLLFFALCRFALGSCLAATFVTSSVLLFEIVGSEYRPEYVMLSQFGFSFGELFVATLDAHKLSWRAVQLCCSLPLCACAIAFLVVKESPRWLVACGEFEQAEVVMMHAARLNGVSRHRSMALWRNAVNEIGKSHERWSTVLRAPFRGVLMSSTHFRFVLVMFVSRFSSGLGYMGLAWLYVGPTSRNVMGPKTLASLDMASVAAGYVLMERYGHRRTTAGCLFISGLAMALTALVQNEDDLLYKALLMLGMWVLAVSNAVLPVQNVELFPQLVRTFGFCWGEASAILGVLSSPYVAVGALETGPWVALVLIAALVALSAFLTITLPETRRPVPFRRNRTPSIFDVSPPPRFKDSGAGGNGEVLH